MVNEVRPAVRRREIGAGDLDGIVDLLVRGFPARPRPYWERGLRRMADRPAVPGCPRFGLMLDDGRRPVGAVLTLFDGPAPRGGEAAIRCNLSSWTVDPAHRLQAPALVASLLKRSDVTFTNVSAAPHTWATIEAQGFAVSAAGRAVVAPALARTAEPARIRADPRAWRDLPEARLLDDHAGYGCTSLVVEARDGVHPFVFLPVRARSGRLALPLDQLIFCRDVAGFTRFAGAIGRWLLARGTLGVVLDGAPPADGPPVLARLARGRHYVKGSHPPRIGDLSYTERAIFGP